MDEDELQEESRDLSDTHKRASLRSGAKKLNFLDSKNSSKKSSDQKKTRKRKSACSEDDPSFSDVENIDDLPDLHKKVLCSFARLIFVNHVFGDIFCRCIDISKFVF
jgi:hypothetical protein